MKWSSEKKGLLIFGLSSALVLAAGVASYVNILKSTETHQWVEQSHQVLKTLESALTLVLKAQSAIRGYVITGDPSRLRWYEEAVCNIPQEIVRLKTLTADNPDLAACRTLFC